MRVYTARSIQYSLIQTTMLTCTKCAWNFGPNSSPTAAGPEPRPKKAALWVFNLQVETWHILRGWPSPQNEIFHQNCTPTKRTRCILSCRFMVISCSHFLQPCAIAIRSQCRFLEAEPWLSASEIVHKIIQQSRPCLSWSSVYTFIYLFFINSHSFIHISICLTHSVLKKDWQINIVSIYLISMLSVLFRFLLDLFVGWLMIHLFISLNLGNTPSTNTPTKNSADLWLFVQQTITKCNNINKPIFAKKYDTAGPKKKVFAHASVPAYGITWQSDK